MTLVGTPIRVVLFIYAPISLSCSKLAASVIMTSMMKIFDFHQRVELITPVDTINVHRVICKNSDRQRES